MQPQKPCLSHRKLNQGCTGTVVAPPGVAVHSSHNVLKLEKEWTCTECGRTEEALPGILENSLPDFHPDQVQSSTFLQDRLQEIRRFRRRRSPLHPGAHGFAICCHIQFSPGPSTHALRWTSSGRRRDDCCHHPPGRPVPPRCGNADDFSQHGHDFSREQHETMHVEQSVLPHACGDMLEEPMVGQSCCGSLREPLEVSRLALRWHWSLW